MKRRSLPYLFSRALLAAVIVILPSAHAAAAELQPATLRAWTAYVDATERRIASELASAKGFLALDFQPPAEAKSERQSVLSGQIPVTRIETAGPGGAKIEVAGGMIHHWRGSVFIPGANLDQVLARVTNPTVEDTRQEDVLKSSVLEHGPDSLRIYLKLQRSRFITVVYNTEHQVQVRRYGKTRASSTSVATRIAELEMPNSVQERERPPGQDHGFLWRLNSYWRYEQVPGGVLVECESLSLSRNVPAVLEAVIRPLIDSTARESMQRTLGSMRGRLSHARP
jgi:hypothetical protein